MMIHKIDIKRHNEDTSLKLFITYSYKYQVKLPNKFLDIDKKIVKACNALFFSLKDMVYF